MTNKRKTKTYFKLIPVLFLVISLVTGIFQVQKQTSFFNKAYTDLTGKNANIFVDVDRVSTNNPNWVYLSQGGEGSDGMLDTVVDEVKDLKPTYIRLDHIFDYYDVVGRNDRNELVYDFSKLDKELDYIRSMGARPFISLSYMPPAISRSSEVDIPTDWGLWQDLVQKTVEHISGRNGLAIPGVYYEVWNEPDLFGDFKLSGDKNYLSLYYHSSKAAESARNVLPFKIGGPATTALYKNWFDSFFKYADKNNLRVDFFSWHRYSLDTNEYADDAANVKSWIKSYPRYVNTLFLMTESGPDSENNPIYDGNKSAIHLISLHLATVGKLDIVFDFEIKDGLGPEKYWGRWGILTNENFDGPDIKPRYEAIAFLNNINGFILQNSGDGTWVKSVSSYDYLSNSVKVLLVNYDKFGVHTETVPLNFSNLPFDKFNFKITEFKGTSTQKEVQIGTRRWQTEVFMAPNTAKLVELTKIN